MLDPIEIPKVLDCGPEGANVRPLPWTPQGCGAASLPDMQPGLTMSICLQCALGMGGDAPDFY